MGFTKKTTDFLKLAGNQTSTKWLDLHKKEHHEFVQKPMQELAFYLANNLQRDARGYKFPLRGFGRLRRPKHKITRGAPAYRDWIHLQASRPSKSIFDMNPGFYFYLSSTECFSGAGLYEPSSRQIKQIRQWIDTDPSSLQKLLKQKSFLKTFPEGLATDKILKTFPRDYGKEHKHIEWLRLQGYYVTHQFSRKDVYAKDFFEQVLETWRQGLKLNSILEEALSDWNVSIAPVEEDLAADAALEEMSGDLWDDRL